MMKCGGKQETTFVYKFLEIAFSDVSLAGGYSAELVASASCWLHFFSLSRLKLTSISIENSKIEFKPPISAPKVYIPRGSSDHSVPFKIENHPYTTRTNTH